MLLPDGTGHSSVSALGAGSASWVGLQPGVAQHDLGGAAHLAPERGGGLDGTGGPAPVVDPPLPGPGARRPGGAGAAQPLGDALRPLPRAAAARAHAAP